jgi:hypothetical protein
MARTQAKKETVQLNGAPSSKLKALQEINEDESSLLPIHKASSSSTQSSCIKPHLQTPKAPLLTSKSLLEECALLLPLCPLDETWSKGVGVHKPFDLSTHTPIQNPQGPLFYIFHKK